MLAESSTPPSTNCAQTPCTKTCGNRIDRAAPALLGGGPIFGRAARERGRPLLSMADEPPKLTPPSPSLVTLMTEQGSISDS